MHLQLADFVPSGHTVEFHDVTYGVPVGGSEVMLEFISIELALGRAPAMMEAKIAELEAAGKADDPEVVFEAIKDEAETLDGVNQRLTDLALGLLRKGNPDVPALKLSPMAAADIIRLSLGREDEIEERLSGQQIAARTLGIDGNPQAEDTHEPGGDADPPTSRQTGGVATKPRKRSATRSRKRS